MSWAEYSKTVFVTRSCHLREVAQEPWHLPAFPSLGEGRWLGAKRDTYKEGLHWQESTRTLHLEAGVGRFTKTLIVVIWVAVGMRTGSALFRVLFPILHFFAWGI